MVCAPFTRGNRHRCGVARGRGFTLVELLVVVSIIALLVAMLMPSLRRAFAIARRATCGTQLHQHGQAAEQYKLQNDNKCVKIKRYVTNSSGNRVRISYAHDLMPFIKDWNLFVCPSQETAYYNSPGKKRLDYGLNHYGTGFARGSLEADLHFWSVGGGNPHKNPAKARYLVPWQARLEGVVYTADAEAHSSPEDIGGVSRHTMEWPIRVSFNLYAYTRHMGGYNWADLGGAVKWHGGAKDTPYNEKWFIPKAEHIRKMILAQ